MAAATLELTPADLPDEPAVMARAGGENFPVALRLLGRRQRRALRAVYGFARLADELGDEYDGDRLAALAWLERELDRAYAGTATAPLLVALQGVLAERALPREPFVRLIEANRLDQRAFRYETWQELQGYCELSANPVGELVLEIFDMRTPERVALSDAVCTGLQLTEHLQDLGEDLRRGRSYVPQEDLDRHESLPAAVRFELARVRTLLWAGAPLAASIPAWRPKLAIAAFAAGGLAALEQIERAGCEVLDGVAPAGSLQRARWLGLVLRRSRERS
ncbi:MAG TPA: squalene/phytoene synthase family protein [Solirubrobacteraceae bacterium]|jgi:squalene synthase HpnC|nr:squalene/phytoene synthase family protein [Solirubrobacteraceae bacterium]